MINERYLGKFSISLNCINNNKNFVESIFKEIIVLEAKFNLASDSIDYTAISSVHFSWVPFGFEPEEYLLDRGFSDETDTFYFKGFIKK